LKSLLQVAKHRHLREMGWAHANTPVDGNKLVLNEKEHSYFIKTNKTDCSWWYNNHQKFSIDTRAQVLENLGIIT